MAICAFRSPARSGLIAPGPLLGALFRRFFECFFGIAFLTILGPFGSKMDEKTLKKRSRTDIFEDWDVDVFFDVFFDDFWVSRCPPDPHDSMVFTVFRALLHSCKKVLIRIANIIIFGCFLIDF